MTATSQIEHATASDNLKATVAAASADACSPIDPMTLARLDYGLFLALRRMGTSRERICSALCLSYAEYDYISGLK
jgi:hypothetical protein